MMEYGTGIVQSGIAKFVAGSWIKTIGESRKILWLMITYAMDAKFLTNSKIITIFS
jgi:hypothetical protein